MLLAVGPWLPGSFGVRPVTFLVQDASGFVTVGIPILFAFAYAATTLAPPLARRAARDGRALHGVLRAVFFIFVGLSLGAALADPGHTSASDWAARVLAVVLGAGLVYWTQGRGTKAQRVPLLLLAIFGLAAVAVLWNFPLREWQYGAWTLLAGYIAAVVSEVAVLRPAPTFAHGG